MKNILFLLILLLISYFSYYDGYKKGYAKGVRYDHYSYYANEPYINAVAKTEKGLEFQIRYYLNLYNKKYGNIEIKK